MKSAEGRGRTLEEAVDAALIQLGESRRNVDVKVLSENPDETVVEVMVIGTTRTGAGASTGAMPAPSAEQAVRDAQEAKTIVEQLLTHMGIRAQVGVRGVGDAILLDGETLRALQTITNLLVGRKLGPDRRVIVDVERYRQRREHTVREIAYRAARQVKVTGDPITLDAMQAFERRAIHLALEDDPDVTTNSVGEEPDRRVVVIPRKAAEA